MAGRELNHHTHHTSRRGRLWGPNWGTECLKCVSAGREEKAFVLRRERLRWERHEMRDRGRHKRPKRNHHCHAFHACRSLPALSAKSVSKPHSVVSTAAPQPAQPAPKMHSCPATRPCRAALFQACLKNPNKQSKIKENAKCQMPEMSKDQSPHNETGEKSSTCPTCPHLSTKVLFLFFSLLLFFFFCSWIRRGGGRREAW